MCLMHKETVVSILDFRYVVIDCPQCRTKVILDMKERSALAEKHNFFAPKDCPGCRSEYDSAMRGTIDSLQRMYRSLLQFSDRITFQGESQPLEVSN